MDKKEQKASEEKLLVGWQEWCRLPDLAIPAIKAKLDTGATTSALHAVGSRRFKKMRKDWVIFDVYPLQGTSQFFETCTAELIDERHIMSSNGLRELRYVISTKIQLAEAEWDIELSLSNREPLVYRMLIGRQAMGERLLIDPHLTCHQGRMTRMQVETLYSKIKKQR